MSDVQILRGIDARPASARPTVATTGKFSVVHLGHRALLERLHREAHELGVAPAVVTFDRHPLEIIAPERAPSCALASVEQRLEQLDEVGIQVVLLLEFTHEVASVEPEAFVERALVQTLRVRKVIEGSDHRFGHEHRGDMALMAQLGTKYGFDVETIGLVRADGEEISSTAIRRLVDDGRVEEAARLMGRPFRLQGRVVEGVRRGRTIGFPTANLEPAPHACVPALGVYAGWWRWSGKRFAGVINHGMRPTFADVLAPKIEIHLFDFEGDLYGETGEIEFEARLRDELKFESVDALVAQIRRDADAARRLLA